MTSTTRPSIKPSARSSRAYAWLLALATGPGLVAVSCSDDAEPDPVGAAGTGGTTNAGNAGSAGNGGSAAGGSAGAAAGSGGSAGASSSAAGSAGLPNGGASGSSDGPDASTGAAFTLTSPAFDGAEGCGPDEDDAELCDLFPEENTGLNGADNVSPQLDWTGAPAGTQSFAIAFHDLSNLAGPDDPFTHWVMWNIPASSTGLPAELPAGQEPGVPNATTRQVSFRDSDAFAGSGAAGNVYEFVLYALSVPSIDPGTTDPDAVQDFIVDLDDDVLGTATLRARSEPND